VCHEVLSTISFYAGRLVVVYGSPPSDAASSGPAASSSSAAAPQRVCVHGGKRDILLGYI